MRLASAWKLKCVVVRTCESSSRRCVLVRMRARCRHGSVAVELWNYSTVLILGPSLNVRPTLCGSSSGCGHPTGGSDDEELRPRSHRLRQACAAGIAARSCQIAAACCEVWLMR